MTLIKQEDVPFEARSASRTLLLLYDVQVRFFAIPGIFPDARYRHPQEDHLPKQRSPMCQNIKDPYFIEQQDIALVKGAAFAHFAVSYPLNFAIQEKLPWA